MINDQIALCCALVMIIPQLVCIFLGIRLELIIREFKKRNKL